MMKSGLLAFCFALLLPVPSLAATWAVQPPGATNCTIRYDGGEGSPILGMDIIAPPSSALLPFVPMKNDNEVSHYSIVNGVLLYNDPQTGTQQANPVTVETALQDDATISAAGQVAMLSYKSVIDGYNSNPAGAKKAFAALSQAGIFTSGDAAEIAKVCATQGMPLAQ
jgi:hypothetical protein